MTFDTIDFVFYKNPETSVTLLLFYDFILTKSGLKLLPPSKLTDRLSINFTGVENYAEIFRYLIDFSPSLFLCSANGEVCRRLYRIL
jgi:hypothetical protein